MMSKARTRAPVPTSQTLTLGVKPGQSGEAAIAEAATSAAVPAAMIVIDYSRSTLSDVSITEVVTSLKESALAVHGGDLRQVEAMLTGQAIALNSMFCELGRRAAVNMGQYIGTAEIYLKLALRAQGQCRATLETLAAIKNPPVVFAKQANIAHGPQQVNNNSTGTARAEKIENQQTGLLEHEHGEQWLDTGTAAAASGSNQTVEAVEQVHRPTHEERKSQGQP